MNTVNELPEEEKQILISNYENKIHEAEEVISFCKQRLSELRKLKVPAHTIPWTKHLIESLSNSTCLLTTDDIYEYVVNKEPSLKSFDLKEVKNRISTVLSQSRIKGHLKSIKKLRGRGNYWALKEWFENGELKEEYKPK